MSSFRTLDDVKVVGKRVLVRLDLNVPIKDGQVLDATRIERVLPTLKELLLQNAKVVVIAHLGRPKGKYDDALSLEPVAKALSDHLKMPVTFIHSCVGEEVEQQVRRMEPKSIILLENLRFQDGEEENDPLFAKDLSRYGEIFVNDAFSVSHRAHASTVGITNYLPSYAGRLMEEELNALTQGLEKPESPVTAIVGGAKISTKLSILKNLIDKVDSLVLGGGIANTFLLAQGHDVGASLCEPDLKNDCLSVLETAKNKKCEIILPLDVVVANSPNDILSRSTKSIQDVHGKDMILDFGPETVRAVINRINLSKTVLWNGPIGLFEVPPFDAGSLAIANAIGERTVLGKLLSIAGGGETLAVLSQAKQLSQVSFASTAGGAFLEWLEGRELPGVIALYKEGNKNAHA